VRVTRSSYPFKSALVTGASSGIGEAFVELLAAQSIPTVVVARRTDRLDQLAARWSCVEVLGADLTTPEGIGAVEERMHRDNAPIDLMINNAGFGTSGDFVDLDPDRLDDEVRLNVGALTRLSHAALCSMVPRGRGFLLNLSSVAGFQPAPRLAVYAATKAYVTSFTESLHEEVRSKGVHVTALCPGLTRTEFQQVSNTESYQTKFPDFAWMSAEDVAKEALDDVAKGKALCVPGALYKSIVAASSVTPRNLTRIVSRIVQRG
jgi:uncharacterized protein